MRKTTIPAKPRSANQIAIVSIFILKTENRKLLTIRSNGAPLHGVLWAISAQTGIRLNITGRVLNEGEPVVEDFSDRPLKDGFVHLLEKYLDRPSYSLVTNGETGELESLHILSDAFGAPPGDSRASRGKKSDLSGHDEEAQPADDSDVAEEAEAEFDPADRAIAAAWEAEQQDEWLESLQVLGNFTDHPRILEVLQPALLSEQPEIRQAAMEAIPWQSAESERVLEDVRFLASQDPEPAVRQTALMLLTQHDESSAETRALLEEIITEEGISNRDFFEQQLARIEEEAAARHLPDTQSQVE